MTEPKLTPAMRRVLARMAKGMFVECETHNRAPYEDLWRDTWESFDPANPNGHLIDGRTMTALIARELVAEEKPHHRIYRITPKGRKALERK